MPNPNKAKSYVTGSSLSNFFSSFVNSKAACQSTIFLLSKLKCLATLATCTSTGQISCAGEIFFHIPKSTPFLSLRTIHLKYIFNLLQLEFFAGAAICFLVLAGASSREKKYSLNEFKQPSITLPGRCIVVLLKKAASNEACLE